MKLAHDDDADPARTCPYMHKRDVGFCSKCGWCWLPLRPAPWPVWRRVCVGVLLVLALLAFSGAAWWGFFKLVKLFGIL